MRIVVSKRADADLLQIDRYLAERNPDAADSLFAEIDRKFRNLSDFPFIGRDRSALQYGMRSVAVDAYVIFYIVERNQVPVVRVLHGRRDIDAEFQR